MTMADLRDLADEVLPTWLVERPALELAVIVGWPYVGMALWHARGNDPAQGLVAGVIFSLLALVWLRMQVSNERLRELQREPGAALDDGDD